MQGILDETKTTGSQREGWMCLVGAAYTASRVKERSSKEEWKAIEQDSGTQPVKKLKTNQNLSEDSKEKEPHYCKSPTVAALGETQSKNFLCHPVTKKSGVQYKKRKPRTDQIKCLQSFSVASAEKVRSVSAKCDAEHRRKALNHCNGLLCAAGKNPFVRLEACSYIDTFVKSSASGTTSSYKLNGFFHIAQDKGKHVFPDGTVEQRDMNCNASRMQNEVSPIKGGLLFNKEETQNREEWFSCCQSESSKCSTGRKSNIGRKPGKKRKITEKSAVQNIFTDMADGSEYELQTEAALAMSSSFDVLGLNREEITLSASCGHTSNLHIGRNTHEAQNTSVWRKNSTKLLAFEDDFKKTSELAVTAKEENSNSMAHHSAASGSLRVLAEIHGVSNSHKSKTAKKLSKVSKKLQQFTCQRTVPMTGKNVWPFESCARTSEWVHKNLGSSSEGKRLVRAVFQESWDKSSGEAVGSNAVTGNLRQLDLPMSLEGINEESTHKIIDSNTECLTSLETPGLPPMDIDETLSNEIVESPVNTDRSAVAFSHDDAQEVKATLTFTTKQREKKKGALTKRNLAVTVQKRTSTRDTNRKNLGGKTSVVKQAFSDLKLMKVLNTENLTKFKIPLCRNKPESRKLESVHSFERITYSPLELLDSSSVSTRQKMSEENFLVNSEQLSLPVASDATSPASTKEKGDEISSKGFQHDGSTNLTALSTLSEHASLYPHPFPDGQPESPVSDFHGTECVLKSSFPDLSWNAVDHPVALERSDGSKSSGTLSEHQNQNIPDIFEAYKEDVLVIDVIQDDPDLFGYNNEDKLELVDCESCSVKESYDSICIKDEKQDLKPECPVTSENRDSVDDNFRHITIQESGMSDDTEISCDWMRKAKETKTHNSSRESSPLGSVTGVNEGFLEDGQPRELDEFLKSFDMDEKASHSVQQILEMIELPRKYCRYYFMTLRGCERAKCWFWHVPEQGDEKVCMTILRTYITIKESGLLKRAVQIFVKYYKEVTPGVDFAFQVLNDLLVSLLKKCLLHEVFQILNVTVQISTL
ncbi:PREDICTED: testis- and ovary-specific PAZ domain-containing protein 1-like, partial [Nestor notabilis]|uniref:testis- and ovary-specific PAZ domain-containing protein 1-like n=1 Tax=Nestor notabilis TaxID=176057 RepID=UPI0005234346